MSEEADKPLETTDKEDQQAGAAPQAPSGPSPTKKKKNQAVLVWVGIACLILAAAAGWKVAKKQNRFESIVRHFSNPQSRDGQALNEWAGELRTEGGPVCKAIAEMITSEQVPDLLKQEGITNMDEMLDAAAKGKKLGSTCESELTSQLNILAWVLAIGGIGMIGVDILRERGKLGGKKT